MRTFYSELSANPSLYSFGYSVYGELHDSDQLDECYEQGFLPFVGAEQQQGRIMYMGRGSRVHVQEFVERHYHSRVRRKVAGFGVITSTLHPIASFPVTNEFIAFFLSYFAFRFGKDSMPEARLRAILSSGFITHIREYTINGVPAAYLLEVHGESFVHTWYHAYRKDVEGSYLGLYLYLDLLQQLREEGTSYLYLGITYGVWMSYKTHFQPLSFWNGREWVVDPKSAQLKELFKADSLRLLTYTDPWRESLTPYYRAPYPFKSIRTETRLLALVLTGLPRLSQLLVGIVLLGFVGIFLRAIGWL